MPSERIQKRIDRLLDEAEQAMDQRDWARAQTLAQDVLHLDPANSDAQTLLAAMDRERANTTPATVPATAATLASQPSSTPKSFVSGRYNGIKFLGEGGKKQVYLAHDELLDRNVAFALIKTEGLDETGRARVKREAQAMGRLASHPHIVSVFDMGDEQGQPYIVTELMAGGDVEGLIEKAPEHRPPLEQTLEIGMAVCRGLEFAHSHGIVHRDLKPGNVWLTESYQPSAISHQHPAAAPTPDPRHPTPVAKLGDFGLAVALDRSRLTQAGMMVGTVSYMPPEQAMGGEVTPRSDLYSLGAMLYEMVTGRPPFVGDESVAIITQHLNVAPVAPSWHNPSVPPGLEVLILRLLEKDAAKRPATAAEVGAMLGSIASPPGPLASRTGEGEYGGPTPDTRPPTLSAANPLYRRAFVGREHELQQLQTAFDTALSGQGGLVMVVGEPGIGKTALCEQLATYAIVRGGKTLAGHCYEEGSLSLPYLPFVEAMRSYVLAREPEGLKQDLGGGAGDVARIVSEVRDRVSIELRPPADPEEERWRLLQAVSGFLRNASLVQPLLLILEDLHDADRGTLELLLHLSRNLAGSRLLLAGTYRDIEVDRAHPLSATLAELRRNTSFSRVLLRGLTADEVQRMLSSISGQEVSWGMAEAVHRQTEGNPLFVQEVLRYLVEEGLIEREDGRWRPASSDTPLAISIPEGLRDVIGKRLAHLSPECNQVLSVAAVIGRDFGLATLQMVAGMVEEPLVAALEAAVRVAVLEDRSQRGLVRFRFTHAFFRQTLYEELFTPRRLRLHQQVARAMEQQYASRLEEHAAELAEHFAQSSDPTDLAKAVQYGELAAGRAMSVYAYGDAARHLEQALAVQEVLDPDDTATRCDLLLALGRALVAVGEPLRVAEEVAEAAVAAADASNDRDRASETCRLALEALFRYGERPFCGAGERDHARRWLERAQNYWETGTAERAWADYWAAIYQIAVTGSAEVQALRQQVLDLPELAGGLELLFCGGTRGFIGSSPPHRKEEQLRLAEAAIAEPREGVSTINRLERLWHTGEVLLEWGRREEAQALWSEAQELATRTQDAYLLVHRIEYEVILATLDGQLEEAVTTCERLVARAEELGSSAFGTSVAAGLAFRPLLYLGRAEQALKSASSRGGAGGAARQICALAHLGRLAEAQSALERLNIGRVEDETGMHALSLLLETATAVGDRHACSLLSQRLVPVATLVNVSPFPMTCIMRLLGGASVQLGEPEKARGYYEQAIEICEKVRFRPELALTRLELAELLLARYPDERAVAIEHLDFAIGELREMKMQPALERALRHKEVLKA